MIKNTKDMTQESLKVLVYGGMGTGKTRFEGTFPGLVMLDYDQGGLSLKSAGIHVDYEDFDGADYDHVKTLKFIKEHTTSGKYKTIGLDSLTTLAHKIMQFTLKENGREGGRPVMQDWGDQMRYLEQVVMAIVSSPIHCVVVAHAQIDQDDITGKRIVSPLITGKLSQKLGIYFDEVYYAEKTVSGKESKYSLLTKNNGQYQARSRLNLPEQIEPDFKNIVGVSNTTSSSKTEVKK